MQGTTSSTPVIIPSRDDVIFIGNPDDLGRSSIIHFDPTTSRSITFATLATVGAWAADASNFYLSNGIDIVVFDLENLTLRCLMPRIFWSGGVELQPVERTEEIRTSSGARAKKRDEMQITNIYLDHNRMIVRSLYGASLVFDTKKLGVENRIQ
jgi:hypothetical protein